MDSDLLDNTLASPEVYFNNDHSIADSPMPLKVISHSIILMTSLSTVGHTVKKLHPNALWLCSGFCGCRILVQVVLVALWHTSTYPFMHQSFVSPAPPGLGNGGAFNFSFFKARVKARHRRERFVVKSLLKAPAPQRLTIMWNNS